MQYIYNVIGMSCSGCEKKITEALNNIPDIAAKVNLDQQTVTINSTKHIDLRLLNDTLNHIGHYQLLDPKQTKANILKPQDRISPSSVYYCPMECEGEKVYFLQGERCPDCKMYLVPIEEKLAKDPYYKEKYSKKNLPEKFKTNIGKYFCPMFCEDDRTYDSNVGCVVCGMDLEIINNELLSNGFNPKNNLFNNQHTVTDDMAGLYYCPMFCEGNTTYSDNVGCPICGMDLVKHPEKGDDGKDKNFEILKKKFFISFIFTLPVFILSMGGMFTIFPFSFGVQAVLELMLTLPVLFYSGWFIMKRGWTSFITWNLNMFSLIALGVFVAFAFSLFAIVFPNMIPYQLKGHLGHIPLYFEAVCVILTLVILGQLMEAIAHKKTGNAIKELISLSPDTANLVNNGVEEKVELSKIVINDILRVKPGEKIPVDGSIIEGSAVINESMITGEPIPVEKKLGEKITSGTINGNLTFLMKAEKVGDQTLLAQIIKMVSDASRSRAPIQKLTDVVSKVFVPLVILISLFTFILWQILGTEDQKTLFAFVNAVAVLIVACPCALGLATPMSLMVGIGKGAQNGILIKNAEALEQMNKMNVLVTDKTGTLTEGKPTLEIIKTSKNITVNDLVKIAASLNQNSEHPLSSAVLIKAKEINVALEKTINFENITGKGVKAIINNETYHLGNYTLIKDLNIDIPSELYNQFLLAQNQAHTISFVIQNKTVIGFLSFTDKIKSTSKNAISLLQQQGIQVIMMTGDNEHTAKNVAKELGINKYFANCLPQDKLNYVKRLQSLGKIVAMTGDGINDAPSLAQSNIGIAMGTGTDIAIESADITLLKGNIIGIVKAKNLSHKMLTNIKENLFFAFIYNLIGIPIAAGILYPFFGILMSPMIAAAAMSCSSLSVILNSLRLNSMRLDNDK